MRKKTQDNSFLHLTTPLGPDVLVIDSLSGSEGLTQPFHFELSLLSEKSDIAFDKIVGQRVSLRIDLVDGLPIHRYVNGFVSRFRQERADTLYTYYSATVVPWIWFLSRSADCRIFQEQTALEIIQKKGLAKGAKRASAAATEGEVRAHGAVGGVRADAHAVRHGRQSIAPDLSGDGAARD